MRKASDLDLLRLDHRLRLVEIQLEISVGRPGHKLKGQAASLYEFS